jgi:cytochrome b pre-mRNA-processing protein 3
MMLHRLFRPSPVKEIGRTLYASVVEQSRAPAIYAAMGAPDTVEGRFEIYTLHVVLLIERLNAAGEPGREASQALFDTYVKSLDDALREMGVGDLSVGKKMRKLGEALFGRAKSCNAAFAALPDQGPLRDLLTRTVYAGADAAFVPALAGYVLAQRQHLTGLADDDLLRGRVAWRPA